MASHGFFSEARRVLGVALLMLCGWGMGLPLAHAHLMAAQRGTLNLVHDGGYLVLSVPMSAFTGTDDDADGRLSAAELQTHYKKIEAQIAQKLTLSGGTSQAQALQGVILTLSPPHEGTTSADQLVVMGRFDLPNPNLPATKTLRLSLQLFGQQAAEKAFNITVTRNSESWGQGATVTQVLAFSPERSSHAIFPSVGQVVADYILLGAQHILLGVDHLLFLLTLLVLGMGWRYGLWVTGSFTLAHSISLLLAVNGWVRASPVLVEPLIAVSIVLLASDNLYRLGRSKPKIPISQRVVLVFACGLLHGLGFASALTELGLQGQHMVWTLLGFNLGIEIGQLAFLLVLTSFTRSIGTLEPRLKAVQLNKISSWLAVLIGGFLLAERLFNI